MTTAAWEAFVVNWLFWSGIAIGAVVFSGLLVLTGAEWAGELRRIAERFGRFLPLSLVGLALLLLHDPRRYARSAVAAAASYAVAFWFCRTPVAAQATRARASIMLLIIYSAAFSVIAYDVIMSLQPNWNSTLFPAYMFTANVYGGIAAVTVAACTSPDARRLLNRRKRRDISAVLVGFALLWLYLVWSQFLVIWYGNLPDEVSFVVTRSAGAWPALAWIVLAARCAFPVMTLLADAGTHRAVLFVSGAVALAGFWIECLLLVAPATGGLDARSGVLMTGGFVAVFAACVLPVSPRVPSLSR